MLGPELPRSLGRWKGDIWQAGGGLRIQLTTKGTPYSDKYLRLDNQRLRYVHEESMHCTRLDTYNQSITHAKTVKYRKEKRKAINPDRKEAWNIQRYIRSADSEENQGTESLNPNHALGILEYREKGELLDNPQNPFHASLQKLYTFQE